MRAHHFFLLFFYALCCSVLYSDVIGQAVLTKEISHIIDSPDSQNAVFAISVRDNKGTEAYHYQSKSRLIPASTYKLITTLSALDILGPDFTFETKVSYRGSIVNGVLSGDIVFKGSGDPSLGATRYSGDLAYEQVIRDVVSYIEAAGITRIKGKIVIDQTYFDHIWVHPSWAWDDLTNYFAGGAAAFNIHENLFFLDFERSTLPDMNTAISRVTPEIPDMHWSNRVKTGSVGSGDNAYIYGDPYGSKRWIEGTIPPGSSVFTIKGAMPDPGKAYIQHLTEHLSSSNVEVEGNAFKFKDEAPLTLIGTLCSDELVDLAVFANHTSNNLFCESIFKRVGAEVDGIGGYESGQEAVYGYLERAGMNISGIRLEDGSGLSSRNRISPSFMTSFLRYQVDQQGRDQIKKLIPQPGSQGTVKSFLKGFASQSHVQVKSGSINNVIAYAGLLESKSGEEYSICVMANGHDSNRILRGQLEKIIEVMYNRL